MMKFVQLLALFVSIVHAQDSLRSPQRLATDLLKHYEAFVDPGPGLEVKMHLVLKLVDLDTKDMILRSNVWEFLAWSDSRLTWDPKEYGGIHSLRLPSDKIWTPDVMSYTNINMEKRPVVNVVVSSDGSVLWVPPTVYHTPCVQMESVDNGPQYNCSIKLGSWTYDGEYLDLTVGAEDFLDLSYFTETTYKIVSATSERHSVIYECCPEPYIDITATLILAPK